MIPTKTTSAAMASVIPMMIAMLMGSSCVDYYDLDKMIGRFNKLSENSNFHKDCS